MRRQSRKANRVANERTQIRQELLAQRGPFCEAHTVVAVARGLRNADPAPWTDMHEKLTRARGGSPTDPENILCLCRDCHQWVTTHETRARELGLVRGRTAEEHRKALRPWEN